MGKQFTELELDELVGKFRDSSLNLPQFTKQYRVPYRLLKNHLRKRGIMDVLNGNQRGERVLVVEEFIRSGKTVETFANERGINLKILEQWISTDEGSTKPRLPEQWKQLVDEFFRSDFLTMSEFARSKRISPDRFKYWLNRFDPEKKWKRHGEEVKRRYVKEFSHSGLSAPQFADSKRINPMTFGLWLRQFDPERTIPNRKAHRILSSEEQAKLIAEFTKSEKLAKDFAADHGINPRTFSTWVGKYRKTQLMAD